MPYSDTPNDYWTVQVNDLVGGWIVTNLPEPLSQHDKRIHGEEEHRGYIIAECSNKADAEILASLANRAGIRR